MKTLKYILSLVLLTGVFAACEEGPTIDKAKLGDYGGTLGAWQEGDCFELDWSDFRLYTTDGYRVVSLGGELSYNVGVSLFDGSTPMGSDFYVVKNVDAAQTKATVNISEIVAALGQKVYTEQVQFGVFLVDERNRELFSFFSASESVKADRSNEFQWGYDKDNSWFASGSWASAKMQSGMVKIDVGMCWEVYDAQMCNIFHNLSTNQKEGESFELSFDVMWVGDDERDSKSISIWTGKNSDFEFIHYDYRWTDDNTELLNPDGSCIQSVEGIRLTNRQFTTVTMKGTIGEAGSKYIGIQINLGDNEGTGEPVGTFYFKNMRVWMGGKMVSECFAERTQGDYLVSVEPSDGGQVLGAGYYNAGESVELTAIPDRNKIFSGWSDGNTDNPRTIWVKGNTQLKPIFDTEDIMYKVDVDAFGGGYVEGGGILASGKTTILTATPYDGYVFTGWSDGNTDNPRELYVDGDIYLTANFDWTAIRKNFQGFNDWFLGGSNNIGVPEYDDEMVIKVEGKGEVWDDNLEVVLQGLENQLAGNEFRMEFDIMWEGDNDNENAGFRICSGVDNYIPNIPQIDASFVPLSAEEVWSEEFNTELIFEDFSEEMGKAFAVGNEWQHIEWGGTIGERGEKYIGIEINLAGFVAEDDQNVLNGAGTFRIKNMRVLINGEQVW